VVSVPVLTFLSVRIFVFFFSLDLDDASLLSICSLSRLEPGLSFMFSDILEYFGLFVFLSFGSDPTGPLCLDLLGCEVVGLHSDGTHAGFFFLCGFFSFFVYFSG